LPFELASIGGFSATKSEAKSPLGCFFGLHQIGFLNLGQLTPSLPQESHECGQRCQLSQPA
jgi:hypothetical protein